MRYYYPTDDLVTAPEILFFWVARMIIAGYEYRNDKPFKNVYLTGIVRDSKRRKMSKSLGNSPDPITLINKYSADGVRVGMLLCSPAGNDLLFDESLPEQGRNFANKIWNAFRLIKTWEVAPEIPKPKHTELVEQWFENKLNKAMVEINDQFAKYRLSDALMIVYRLFWDDFSSWYLETIKPEYKKPVDQNTYNRAHELLEKLLKLLHPFMPFITEEVWQTMTEREPGESIMIAAMPQVDSYDDQMLSEFEMVKEIVGFVRTIRQQKQIKNTQPLDVELISKGYTGQFNTVIQKLARIGQVDDVTSKPANAVPFITNYAEVYLKIGDLVNSDEELKKLIDELEYTKGFLKSVMKKLDNDRFVSGAPEHVVNNEKKKRADAEEKIKTIEEQIAGLKQDGIY
jgi:valyl-tRNA synthetase